MTHDHRTTAGGHTAAIVRTEATTYTVCAVPETVQDWVLFAIDVDRTAPDRWAIRRGKRCLSSTGEWEWESIPSERTDEWLATHRFDLAEALRLAQAVAPHITCNGFTAARVAAEWTTAPSAPNPRT